METPVTSLGTRSGVHWMRRKARSSERASARASMVFPTPGTSSSRTWPSTRSAAKSCSVPWRFPMTTVPICSASRSAASRTVRVMNESLAGGGRSPHRPLGGLERRDGGPLRRRPGPNGARRRKRQRETHERSDRVQAQRDRVLFAQHERAKRALDEQDESDGDERAHRELPSVYRPYGHDERDGGEEVHEPAGIVAGG